MRSIIGVVLMFTGINPAMAVDGPDVKFGAQLRDAQNYCHIEVATIPDASKQQFFTDCVHGRIFSVSIGKTPGSGSDRVFSALAASKAAEDAVSYVMIISCDPSPGIMVMKMSEPSSHDRLDDQALVRYRFGDTPTNKSLWASIAGKAVSLNGKGANEFLQLAKRIGDDSLLVEIQTSSSLRTIEFKQLNFKDVAEGVSNYCS